MIRILQVVPNMNRGGIETLLMNLYRNLDKEKFQFDFLVHHKDIGAYDNEIISLGGKIYYFSVMDDKNIFKYIKDLFCFFKKHQEYKIVHGHMASLAFIYFGVAKICGIKIRIAHSHGDSYLKTLKGYAKFVLFKLTKFFSTYNLACSNNAGRYLFNKKPFTVFHNAINVEEFSFNKNLRDEYRKLFDIGEDEIVFGHIGRFNLQKNHIFLIDVFNEIFKIYKKSKLFLVGDGELKKEIIKYIENKECKNQIYLLGVREDTNALYQMFDCFLMPSLFEGLPVVGIEAQAADLPCFFSSNITKEVRISKKCFFYSLEIGSKQWAKDIMKNLSFERQNNENIISEAGYNIKTNINYLEKLYLDLIGEDKC